ncbi:TonB-dependent receptor [Parahaliea mediterranea]|uniref:TonB-dependent receptor n=1 Tax=Parahaliea mediterranea TaxID=651086 RepID=UPI000E2FA7B0|nr:TonB-dependent receptor [Parahaliea mediterranea]
MQSNRPVKALLTLAVLSATGFSDLAQAQVLEEVIVTARKRAESLQDVPMAVSSFNADMLRNAQVDNILDLERMSPNVTLTTTGGLAAGGVSVFIRGIGNDVGFDQGVGIYVDDVYLNQTTGALLDVFDVERVEVLKGPQGNLYGRNTIGGAIKFISKEPTEELEGRVEVSAGRFDMKEVKGNISGPIIGSTLLGSFAAVYKDRDGIQTNSFNGDEYWSEDVKAFRGSLLWNASDSLRLKLSADHSRDRSAPSIPNRVFVDTDTLSGIDFVISGANTFLGPGTGIVDTPNDASLPTDIDTVSSEFVDGFDEYKIDTTTISLTLQWELSERWDFKSVTAGRSSEFVTPYDFDGSNQQFITTINDTVENEDLSQEFQFNFNGENLHAVMGLYYLDGLEERPSFTHQYARLRAITQQTKDTYVSDRELESVSAYGTIDWDITEKWQLSFGGRYTQDKKVETTLATVDRTYFAYAGLAGFPSSAIVSVMPGQEANAAQSPMFAYWASQFAPPEFNSEAVRVVFPENTGGDDTWSQFSPSARLTWFAAEDLMLYTAYQQGFKSGGFQRDSQDADSYEPEVVDAYTIGVKSTWLNGSLRINGEAFYNDYSDKQLQTIVLTETDLQAQVGNVGEVETSGAEVELTWLPPVDGLTIGANIGYLDAEVKSYQSGGEDIAETTALGFSPQWTAQARVMYEFDVSNLGNLMLGADIAYRDDSYTNSPIDLTSTVADSQFQEAFSTWNAIATFTTFDGSWRVALEGKNLSDKRVLSNSYNVGPFVTGAYSMPRTWAVSLAYEF